MQQGMTKRNWAQRTHSSKIEQGIFDPPVTLLFIKKQTGFNHIKSHNVFIFLFLFVCLFFCFCLFLFVVFFCLVGDTMYLIKQKETTVEQFYISVKTRLRAFLFTFERDPRCVDLTFNYKQRLGLTPVSVPLLLIHKTCALSRLAY